MHRNVLKLIRDQIKKHSFGKLAFLSCIGPRAWGFAPDNIDYDYQGIYLSKEDNTYWFSISGTSINGFSSIPLISFERIIGDILHSDIDILIFINSPIIYVGKEFLEFKKWVNSNFSKQVYLSCQIGRTYTERKDYLYDFFFIGNGIAILEQKKVIANLPELNKKILRIQAMDKVINEERMRLPFRSEQICKEIQNKLKARLGEADKKSCLPGVVDPKNLPKLKIIKKINPYFWYWPEGSEISREKGKK
jgi:hypothetical protein